jgi:hypothetical protein
VLKADPAAMRALAKKLQAAIEGKTQVTA